MNELTQDMAQTERERYVRAWNETMIKIWQERITLLEVIDTSRLLHSVAALPIRGTGRETPRGNKGDIGRTKVRQRRPWFSKRYYSSVLNLRDFLGENIGREFQGIMADTFERINKL